MPYENYAYKMTETSVEDDRSKVYQARRSAVNRLKREISKNWREVKDSQSLEKELLWNCVIRFEGYRFKTAKGLPFTYEFKLTKAGKKSGGMARRTSASVAAVSGIHIL
jgi:hypothetical protein